MYYFGTELEWLLDKGSETQGETVKCVEVYQILEIGLMLLQVSTK